MNFRAWTFDSAQVGRQAGRQVSQVCLTSEQRGDAPLVDAPDAALPPQRPRHVRRPLVLGRPRRGLLHLKQGREEGRKLSLMDSHSRSERKQNENELMEGRGLRGGRVGGGTGELYRGRASLKLRPRSPNKE